MIAKPRRVRADLLLIERGLAATRAQAQALILAGDAWLGDARIGKPGDLLLAGAEVRVAARSRFVSRGGDKLEAALAVFCPQGLEIANRACLDVGASTGGFTDCLLQHGALRVVAVDVGHGQLATKLRNDARVDVRERMNARRLTVFDLGGAVDLVVVDASFIGIGKLIHAIAGVLRPGGDLVALVKPQFEAGRVAVSRGRGVIRDEPTRAGAIADAISAIQGARFTVLSELDSPVRGPKGNVERFVWARLAPGET